MQETFQHLIYLQHKQDIEQGFHQDLGFKHEIHTNKA